MCNVAKKKHQRAYLSVSQGKKSTYGGRAASMMGRVWQRTTMGKVANDMEEHTHTTLQRVMNSFYCPSQCAPLFLLCCFFIAAERVYDEFFGDGHQHRRLHGEVALATGQLVADSTRALSKVAFLPRKVQINSKQFEAHSSPSLRSRVVKNFCRLYTMQRR